MAEAIPPEVREGVLRRANGRCERCLRVLGAFHLHHRLQKSLGGRDTVANLVAICPRCHSRVHEQVLFDDVYGNGWLLRSYQDPQRAPVRMPRGWMLLFDDGDCRRIAWKGLRVARPVGGA